MNKTVGEIQQKFSDLELEQVVVIDYDENVSERLESVLDIPECIEDEEASYKVKNKVLYIQLL